MFNFLFSLFWFIPGQGADCFKGMMDYIVICFWNVDFNIGMKLGLVIMFCRVLLWQYVLRHARSAPRFSLLLEISRNKVVVPEGAAGLVLKKLKKTPWP